jgi:quercetin dioxygenase-like cupin family protein
VDSVTTMTTSLTSSRGGAGRAEVIERPETARVTVLMPGIELRAMAGDHNGAEGLFTGLLSLAAGASYPFYSRPAAEAMVALEGVAAVDVEDRRYRLGPLDAIAVRPGLPRRVVNLSAERPAVLHVALASPRPDQGWINGRFTAIEQPADSMGRGGTEWVRRRATAPPSQSPQPPRGPFQEIYNAELGWGGMGISGRYAAFEPGARLPCHRHAVDAAITIIQGTATAIVEGRRHELSGRATAMIPRDRGHYVINLTLEPMALILVHTGDMPDFIVMDEMSCVPHGPS